MLIRSAYIPNNHVALAADLGLDQVKVYWLDLRTGKMTMMKKRLFIRILVPDRGISIFTQRQMDVRRG